MGDITAGLFTAIGVIAALYDRDRTGEAKRVDVAMLDAQVATLENAIARYVATGEVPGPLGSRHPSITPFEAFEAGEGFLVVAAGNDALFAKLCDALACSELAADARFLANDDRTRNADALKQRLEAVLGERSTEDWLTRLRAAGVPCGPVNDVADVLRDPQVAARNMVVTLDDPVAGKIAMAGNPVKLSAFPDPPTRSAAPELDAHREQILSDFDG